MIRYLIVGVGNTVLGYAMFLLMLATLGGWLKGLVESSLPAISWGGRHYYLLAQLAAWVLMVPVSTTTLKYLAFRSRGPLLNQVGRAYLVYAPAQGVSSLTLWLAVQMAQLSPQVGQLAAVVAATIFTYLGHKHYTFGVPPTSEDPAVDEARLDV